MIETANVAAWKEQAAGIRMRLNSAERLTRAQRSRLKGELKRLNDKINEATRA
jgi:hypothetical protein